jgi:hypothetical protein
MPTASTSSPPPFYGVTFWTRLQLDTTDATLARAQQVQVRDPLWLLARQWQVGELAGFDGGSPIAAYYQLQQSSLTAYQPDPSTAASTPPVETINTGDPPLEVRVEREAFPLGLRGSVQLGLRFESIVRDALGAVAAIPVIAQFRTACAISATVPATEIPDPKAQAFRQSIAGRVTDGYLLFQTAMGQPTGITLPTTAAAALTSFVTYCQALYTVPSDQTAWDRNQLAFEFNAAAEVPSPGSPVGLVGPDFRGGQLDWYSLDYSSPAAIANNPQPISTTNGVIIPHRLSVPGMPGVKFWEFEDGQTNLGDLDTQVVDLTKMLLADFAAVASNNWFQFSVLTPIGTLNRLAALGVIDTFGAQTLVPPTGDLDPPSGTGKAWQMFTLDGDSTRRDTLLLAPTLGRVMDGPLLEDVLFFRDDMAAMAWAVERSLAGPLDNAVSGYESQLAPPPPGTPLPAGADVNYLAGTTVPKNWIPMLPYVATDQSLMLRRGGMFDPTSTATPPLVPARGVVLTPGELFVVRDQAIARAGVQVDRYIRRARWIDGSTYCWMARKTRSGKGQGSSGLAFDVLATAPPAKP